MTATNAGLEGRLIGGRYRVGRRVASGGTADVYAAEHIVLSRSVAAKVLRDEPSRGATEERRQAFAEEARILRELDHPLIPKVWDVVECIGRERVSLVLVVGWIPGERLADVLQRTRGAPPRSALEVWAILEPLAHALAHAHERGIVHGDVTPSNVQVEERGGRLEVTGLLDFGSARNLSALADGAPQGGRTRAYAAPEQLTGGRVGPWTDVHALGLLFLELLSNRAPYGHDDPGLGAIDAERPSPQRLGVDAGAFTPLVRGALALDTTCRYPTAALFAAMMNEAATGATTTSGAVAHSAGLEVAASPPAHGRAALGRASRWRSTVPGVLGAAALLAAAGGIVHFLDLTAAGRFPLMDRSTATITRRLEQAGFKVTSSNQEGGRRTWTITAPHSRTTTTTVTSVVVLRRERCEQPPAVCAPKIRDLLTRDTASVRGAGDFVAYAADGDTTAWAWAVDEPSAVRARDAVAGGLGLSIVGTIEPSAKPSDAGRSASGLETMGPPELETQLKKAQLDVTWVGPGTGGLLAIGTYRAGGASGTAYVYDGDPKAVVASLKPQAEAFSWASRGSRLLVLRAPLADAAVVAPAVLTRVLDGLPIEDRGTHP